MEVGAHVWLRSNNSRWGWVPAKIDKKEEAKVGTLSVINLTLVNDTMFDDRTPERSNDTIDWGRSRSQNSLTNSFYEKQPFEVVLTLDPEQMKTAEHDDIKLRNLSRAYQLKEEEGLITNSPEGLNVDVDDDSIVGGVNDLIGLTHLHEPAILHALRLRYASDIIYTATGPILIAVNPFKPMPLYDEIVMEKYRIQGERGNTGDTSNVTPFKRRANDILMRKMGGVDTRKRLPPHAYLTADDAYRAMMRGMENKALMGNFEPISVNGNHQIEHTPINQSILVSGESGAGKTVTTKIVLNYLAMLSKAADGEKSSFFNFSSPGTSGSPLASAKSLSEDDVSIEQQVLQSNPILESFGNARTIRNDNSSRFGKYVDIRFTPAGKLTGASIETYLLEKVRLIHPSIGERNYHVFYQFLESATKTEREQFYLDNFFAEDFYLLNQTGTFDRRDGVSDDDNHQAMLDAMINIGFAPETIQSLMRLIVAILFAGNITFTSQGDDTCSLDENHASLATASLLGVDFSHLASSLTSRNINTVHETIEKQLSLEQAKKACEALIKAIYGAIFEYIVVKVNSSINASEDAHGHNKIGASIGVLDIFGFETFQVNNFEQLCINYTNEALQQQFNKYVFKLEQLEYEKEGILWKYIAFPDNQDVIDLIDKKHTGLLAILDEQCIVPRSTDEKFTRYLYSHCSKDKCFSASSAQRVDFKFCIEHYAGKVEYSTDSWLEKNKDQLPAKSANLLKSSSFKLLESISKYVRSEERSGRGTLANKSVGAQFATQLRTLRVRIDTTTPHYIRCLKPNDDLVPNYFEPKNIVEQLRCGGVLEAVRVSRAGYPTRYPHDVFLARYNVLGDRKDKSPMSPLRGHESSTWNNTKEEKLKRLISQIAFKVWNADHQMILTLMEAERMQQMQGTPKRGKNSFLDGPKSLALPSSTQKSFESSNMKSKFKTKKTNTRISLSSTMRERSEQVHNFANPESEEDYFELDFVSRCALAGLQLGRSKVFLRREAFDRIEALRSQQFFGSASKIQAMVRAKIYRTKYLQKRAAAIRIQRVMQSKLYLIGCAATLIQSVFRMVLAKREALKLHMRKSYSARKIQRAFRRQFHSSVMHLAARKIQSIARGIRSRNRYYSCLFGLIRLQAQYRGILVRRHVLNAVTMSNRDKFLGKDKINAASKAQSTELTSRKKMMEAVPFTSTLDKGQGSNELYQFIQEENWAKVESILDKKPELAEEPEPSSGELPLHVLARHSSAWTLLVDMVLVLYPKALIHRDNMGALPIHHAAAHDNISALEIIYSAYNDGINDVDRKGRLPLHVAAEFDAADAVKFLLSKSPEGAYTMIYRPVSGNGGGLPLHTACRNYASIGVITALLAENFASAKRCDENGELPLHLILKCGDVVDQVVVKTLITCFADATSRTDMNGDLPLMIALKHQCKSAVVNCVLMQNPNAATIVNSRGQSALFLAFQNNADDRTILGLLNHAPELATYVDKESGLLPIQVATQQEHSHFIVHNLLKRDMPIDLNEKIRARLLPHHYSWNHIVSNTEDKYYQVVTKVLQLCTQPQVLALAHVEGSDGRIALASSTTVCKHELRVMLRLFNSLEVVNQRPAYTNPLSDTQIFYALRYEPPQTFSSAFTILHEDKKDQTLGDYVEDLDDTSVTSGLSRHSGLSSRSTRSNKTSRSSMSQHSIEDKLKLIKKEKGQQVIAKLTSRSDIVERELKVRKDYHLSRHYVPAIISVHHTVQHAAYSEAMAEPGYCITMEGADTTAENLMLDMRKAGKSFPLKALKRIGISLLHMHEHGLVHGDFGTHNIGKFGSRWKLLGVGGSSAIGSPTDPNRGFYHPPEAIVVEGRRTSLGKRSAAANVVSIPAKSTYDIWAYGIVLYEAISGTPLAQYSCRGKRAMTSSEIARIGQWDDHSVKKALKLIEGAGGDAKDLLKSILNPDPNMRISTMRDVLEHPFFSGSQPNHNNRVHPPKQNEGRQDGGNSVGPSQSNLSAGNYTRSSRRSTQSRGSRRRSTPGNSSQRKASGGEGGKEILDIEQEKINDENSLYGDVHIKGRYSVSKRKSLNKSEIDDNKSVSSQTSKFTRRFGSLRNHKRFST